MRESAIERYLVQQVAKAGGKAYKWVSPGNRGVPDRIVFIPHPSRRTPLFVELKAPCGELSIPQKNQLRQLEKFGQVVCVLKCKKDVDFFIKCFTTI